MSDGENIKKLSLEDIKKLAPKATHTPPSHKNTRVRFLSVALQETMDTPLPNPKPAPSEDEEADWVFENDEKEDEERDEETYSLPDEDEDETPDSQDKGKAPAIKTPMNATSSQSSTLKDENKNLSWTLVERGDFATRGTVDEPKKNNVIAESKMEEEKNISERSKVALKRTHSVRHRGTKESKVELQRSPAISDVIEESRMEVKRSDSVRRVIQESDLDLKRAAEIMAAVEERILKRKTTVREMVRDIERKARGE